MNVKQLAELKEKLKKAPKKDGGGMPQFFSPFLKSQGKIVGMNTEDDQLKQVRRAMTIWEV